VLLFFSASVYSGDWFQAALTGTMTLFCGYQAYSTYRKIKSRKVIKKLVKDLAEKTNFLEAGLLTTCMFMADKSLGREFEFDDAQSFGEILTQKMEEYYKQFDAHKSKGDIDQTLQYFKALETLYIGMRAYLKKTHKIIEREEIVLPRDLIKRTIQKMDKQMREDAKELSLCYGYKSIVNYNR